MLIIIHSMTKRGWVHEEDEPSHINFKLRLSQHLRIYYLILKTYQGRSQYEANRGTHLGKILLNVVDSFLSTEVLQRWDASEHTRSAHAFKNT